MVVIPKISDLAVFLESSLHQIKVKILPKNCFNIRNNLENGSFRIRENLLYKKTADMVLMSLFMRIYGKCNSSYRADYEGMKQELKAFQKEFDELTKTEDVKELWTSALTVQSYVPAKTLMTTKLTRYRFLNRSNHSLANVGNFSQKQRKTRRAKAI